MQFMGLEAVIHTTGADELIAGLRGISTEAKAATAATVPLTTTLDQVAAGMSRAGAAALDQVAYGMSQAGVAAEVASAKMAGLTASTEEAGVEMSAFGRQFEGVAERMVERLGLMELAFKSVEWFQTGLEANRAMELLNHQLDIMGHGLAGLHERAEAAIASVSALGGATETELTVALQRLVLTTGNAQWSMDHLAMAQDIASATGKSLEESAVDLGRAYNGVWINLERAGLVTKDSTDKMGDLERSTKAATAAANEGAGAWHKLWVEMKNVAEEGAKDFSASTGWLANLFSGILAGTPEAIVHRLQESRAAAAGLSLPPQFVTPPPIRPLAGVTTAGRRGSPEQVARDLLIVQEQNLETELKTTTDLEKRLKLISQIYEIEEKLAKLKDPHKDEQLETIRSAIDRTSARGLGKDSAPLVDTIMPKLSPTAGTLNLPGDDSWLGSFDQNIRTWADSIKIDVKKYTVDIAAVATEGFQKVGQALGAGVQAAFATHQMGKAVKAFGTTLLEAFGEMVSEQGQALISYGVIMLGLTPLLTNLFTAGPAAIAAGLALVALGSAFSAAATGSAGGSAGGGSTLGSLNLQGVNATNYITPTAGQPFATGTPYPGQITPVVVNVVGYDDPTVQRGIMKAIQKATGRNFSAVGMS